MDNHDLVLVCSCSSLDHVVRFSSWDDGEAFVSVSLDHRISLWRRIKLAFRLIFGVVCRFGDAAEIVLDHSQMLLIKAWCEESLPRYHK